MGASIRILLAGLVYPPVSHWAWSDKSHGLGQGWLNAMGYQDFAGSGVVHLVGGVCALVACIMVGPRQGRWVQCTFIRYQSLVEIHLAALRAAEYDEEHYVSYICPGICQTL